VSKHLSLIILVSVSLLACQGCKWRDDFRQREQPQYFEATIKPTLNQDSLDYIGNDTNWQEQVEESTPMPDIDDLSPIPPVPDEP